MGVVNLESDKAGERIDPEAALEKAHEIEQQGADLIELHGGPIYVDSRPLTADEELSKLVPVMRKTAA